MKLKTHELIGGPLDGTYGYETNRSVMVMGTIIIASFKNEEFGIESKIVEASKGGYSVTLWDIDCGEAVRMAVRFPKFEDAETYAKKIANV